MSTDTAVRHDESAAGVAQARIRTAVPIARVIYPEPGLRRGPAPERSGATPPARD